MVALVLGLKLRLLSNTLRRGAWQRAGAMIAVVLVLAAGSTGVSLLVGSRDAAVADARVGVVLLGSLLVLGCLLLPLIVGADDPLDPRSFRLYGIRPGRLATSLAAAGVLGLPGAVVAAMAVSQVAAWSRGPLPVLLALLGVPLVIVTCALAARVSTSIASFVLAGRRARESTGIAALVALVCVSPAVALFGSAGRAGDGSAVLLRLTDVLGWTPFGAVWSAPADAAAGHPAEAIGKCVLAGAFAMLLWLAWRGLVGAMLRSSDSVPSRTRQRMPAGLGWFASLPATPLGAITARSLTYWARDARYRVPLAIIPVVPVVVVLALMVGGVDLRLLTLLPLPVMALFLSWTTHNDIALDNTAIWLHVASAAAGVADRLGRIVPTLVLGVILVGVGAPLTALAFGDGRVLPSVIGVSGCIVLSGPGIGSLVSARLPYPAVRPGDSPFSQPQATGSATSALIQGLSFLTTVLFSVPPLVFALFGLQHGGGLPWVSLAVGIGIGVLTLIGGVRAGGAVFDRRGPEILAFTLRN